MHSVLPSQTSLQRKTQSPHPFWVRSSPNCKCASSRRRNANLRQRRSGGPIGAGRSQADAAVGGESTRSAPDDLRLPRSPAPSGPPASRRGREEEKNSLVPAPRSSLPAESGRITAGRGRRPRDPAVSGATRSTSRSPAQDQMRARAQQPGTLPPSSRSEAEPSASGGRTTAAVGLTLLRRRRLRRCGREGVSGTGFWVRRLENVSAGG